MKYALIILFHCDLKRGKKGVFPPKVGFLSKGNTNTEEGMAQLAET